MKEALALAITKAGGQAALARALGGKTSTAHISYWLHHSKLPAERVLDVERITGVSRHDLRPDIYPREPGA